MVRRICEIRVRLNFIFQLVHYSSEDVSFNSICLKVLEGIKQFDLLIWFKKTQLETPFKGDNVKALVKMSNCENLVLYFSEKVQKIAAFAMLFWFSVTKQSFENGFSFCEWSEIPSLPTSLKIKRTLARPLHLEVLYFLNGKSCQMISACIFMTANATWDLCGWAHPYKTNC